MTRSEIIARFDELHPNAVSADIKAAWLDADDELVRREIIEMHEDAPQGKGEDEVYVYPPYDEYYIHSLASHLYSTLGEVQRYANEAAMAQSLLENFENDYIKTHRPITQVKEFSVI